MAEETILIIEDEYDVASMMNELVREQGYQPVLAHDGVSGLDLAVQERPDLILLDLRLPQISGVDLLSQLQDHQLNLPVVVVTGWGSEELALQALRMGVKDYVKKPFSAAELLEAVEGALQEGRLRRENTQLVESLRTSRDQVAERSTDLKTLVNRLVRLQRVGLELGTVTVGADLNDVYRRLTEHAAHLLDVKRSAVFVFDPQRQELVCQKPAFGFPPDVISRYRVPLDPESPIWEAWEKGQSLIANDLTSSPLLGALGLSRQVAGDGIHSTMFSVLRRGGQSFGLVQVSDKLDGRAFTPDDLQVLEIFAAQSAIAIENARLFTTEKRRSRDLEALAKIVQDFTAAVGEPSHALMERIARGACELLGADSAAVIPLAPGEPDTFDVAQAACFGNLLPLELAPEIGQDDPLHRVREKDPLLCEDMTDERPELVGYPLFQKEFVRSFAGVLLRDEDKELGVLYVNYRTSHEFEAHEVTALCLIARQAELALAKSQAFQTLAKDLLHTDAELKRKVHEVEELHQVNGTLNSTADIEAVFDSVLEGAIALTDASSAAILMLDGEGDPIVAYTRQDDQTFSEKIEPGITEGTSPRADEDHGPTLASQLSESTPDGKPRFSVYRQLIPDGRSFVSVPITSGSGKKRLGILAISSPQDAEFGPDDVRTLEGLADQAAIAIRYARLLDNVRLYQQRQAEAERIAAMADVAGNMVHRINNTVGAIRPLIQQIEIKMDRGTLDDVYLRDKLEGIRLSADRTLEVASQIRRPFRSVPLQPIEVNESIAAAWADLRTPPGVKAKFDYDADLPPVKATRQLDEVFRNLMKNALDAMAEAGGFMYVRSQRLDDRRVEVVVRDSGPGIPEELRERVFEMGATTKPGGTGFGLWWSRTFVRRLGGDLLLEKHDGEGCLFRVLLPISEE
jgi:GAF domain-containing protein/DNA-binding response OmpR family regulator